MRKLFKVLGSAVLVAAVCFAIAGCSQEETKTPATRTHDQITHVITGNEEGKTAQHNFVDGKCTMCDETTIFRQDPMLKSEEILLTEQQEKGTVESFWYKTRAYGVEEKFKNRPDSEYKEGDELWIWKRAFVYLPYGYDPEDTETKYNVMYMMHGNKLNEGYWFGTGTYATDKSAYTGGYGTENVLDYLIENDLAEKTIFVAMTMYQYYDGEYREGADRDDVSKFVGGNAEMGNVYSGFVDKESDLGYRLGWGDDNMGDDSVYWKEWYNSLMPYVVTHYNTYTVVPETGADPDSQEFKNACIAARDHVAFTGLSRGGQSVRSVMTNCLEYISYFAYESTGVPDEATIANINAKADTYPCRYIFISCGSQEGPDECDAQMLDVRDQLGWTQNEGSDIANGDRICFIQVNGTAHNYATWITNLYNFALVAFK